MEAVTITWVEGGESRARTAVGSSANGFNVARPVARRIDESPDVAVIGGERTTCSRAFRCRRGRGEGEKGARASFAVQVALTSSGVKFSPSRGTLSKLKASS